MNSILPEHDLGVEAGLQVVPADAAHVLAQQMGDLPGFHVRHQPFPAGALKIAAGPSIVRIVDEVGIAALLRVGFEVSFLVQNGVRVARDVIVAGRRS